MARFLVTTAAGRFILVALPLAIIAGVLWRDRIVAQFGLGLVPLGAWAGASLYLALAAPLRALRLSRLLAGALVAAIATTGLLGMFSQPVDTVLGQVTSGGNLGRMIARAPFEWSLLGPGPWELLLASLRVAAVATVAAAIFLPRHALSFARAAASFTARQTRWAIAAAGDLRARMNERAARRRAEREAARISAMAAVQTEASLLEDPPTAVGRPKHRRIGPDEDPAGAAVEEDTARTGPAQAPRGQPWLPEPSAAASNPSATGVPGTGPAPVVATAANGANAAYAAASGANPAGNGAPSAATRPAAAPAPRPAMPNYHWKLPPIDLLKVGKPPSIPQAEIEATSDLIVDTLAEHGVEVKISQVTAGPTVTMYGIAPGWERAKHKAGKQNERWEDEESSRKRVRVDTILAREKDLALALASPNLRFESPIPGESLVGIEVPNSHPSIVTLRSAMQSDAFKEFERKAALPIALGIASSSGEVLADLTKMPHLLVAGATGSGKSVCMNTVITGFLLTRTPAQVQLILIDPKRVELTPYTGVPHLACPPVVEADRAVLVLKAVVKEMMARYAILQSAGAKNIAAYNERAPSKLPYLVVAIDELADLMLTSANEVERLIVRLAQLGRATGVHLIVATQRPSVDVVTGLIKANFPSRIAFAVSSQVDSRTILDSNGAERLLGRGDMLFLPIDRPKPMRVQGAFLTDAEVEAVVRNWRASGGPRVPELVVEEPLPADEDVEERDGGDDQSLFVKAQELARSQNRLSTSLLQRRLRIGYPRAARLMDELEDAGIVGAGEPGKPRQVLVHQ